MDENLLRRKWSNHFQSSRKRGLRGLTLDEYREKLILAGIGPELVGRSKDSFHLARIGDVGDYTMESCRFVPHLINRLEMTFNGGTARAAEKLRGRTKLTHSGLAAMAEKKRLYTVKNFPHLAIGRLVAAEKIRGRNKHNHPGYAASSEKMAQYYSFISPDGVRHSGKNVEEFAKKVGLKSAGFSRVKTGLRKQYRGWRKDPEWAT